MKLRLILILALCVVLEGTLVSYPLTLLAIMFASILGKDTHVVLAFTAGLILDLFVLRLLGGSSLYFLVVLFLGQTYQKKIYEGAFIYRFVFLLVSFVVYSLIFYRLVSWIQVAVTALALVILLLWFDKLFAQSDKQRLTV